MYRIMFFPGHISGGVGTVVLNIFRNIDKSRFTIDFCVPDSDSGEYDSEIIQAGSKIFHIPQIRKVGPHKFIKTIKELLKKEGPYDAVHIHSVHMGALAITAAKRAGVKRRIYHVHNTQDAALDHLPFHGILETLVKHIIIRNSTDYLACGQSAGKYIYGKMEFSVVNNAVSTERFYPFEDQRRNQIREELGIKQTKYVVGNIARFSAVKNHARLVELAKFDKMNRNELVFLLVGDGEKNLEIREKAKAMDCEDKIIFVGQRSDTDNMYNAMDVFCLPSFFEGLPVTAIEAQACGLPCVFSDVITKECNLGISDVDYLALSETDSRWIEAMYSLVNSRNTDAQKINEEMIMKKYEIGAMVQQVEEIYEKLSGCFS